MIQKFVAALVCQYTIAQQTVKDVRGGASLQVTYPLDLVDSLGDNGSVKVSLGNFGHIQYGTSI